MSVVEAGELMSYGDERTDPASSTAMRSPATTTASHPSTAFATGAMTRSVSIRLRPDRA
jgi:hypothetical protein